MIYFVLAWLTLTLDVFKLTIKSNKLTNRGGLTLTLDVFKYSIT